jgi:hypothetical protein
MPAKEGSDVWTQLELSLADYNLKGASIGSGPDGIRFACTIGPVSEATLAALDGAAQNHGRVCLLLPQPLLLDLVVLERKEAHSIRIVGHVVGSTSGSSDFRAPCSSA